MKEVYRIVKCYQFKVESHSAGKLHCILKTSKNIAFICIFKCFSFPDILLVLYAPKMK